MRFLLNKMYMQEPGLLKLKCKNHTFFILNGRACINNNRTLYSASVIISVVILFLTIIILVELSYNSDPLFYNVVVFCFSAVRRCLWGSNASAWAPGQLQQSDHIRAAAAVQLPVEPRQLHRGRARYTTSQNTQHTQVVMWLNDALNDAFK